MNHQMKCNFCKKIVDEKEVIKKFGRYITEWGCCSTDCYTRIMTGETPVEEPKEEPK